MTKSAHHDNPAPTEPGFTPTPGLECHLQEINEPNLRRWRWADTNGNHEVAWIGRPYMLFHAIQRPDQDGYDIHILAGTPGTPPAPGTAADARAMARRVQAHQPLHYTTEHGPDAWEAAHEGTDDLDDGRIRPGVRAPSKPPSWWASPQTRPHSSTAPAPPSSGPTAASTKNDARRSDHA